MKLISLQCPYCGGSFQFNSNGHSIAYCSHCGQKVLIDDEVKRTEHKKIKIDVARIHEADVKEQIKLRELELEIENKKQHREMYKMKMKTALVFFIISILLAIGCAFAHMRYEGSILVLILIIIDFICFVISLITAWSANEHTDAYQQEMKRMDHS